MRLIVNIATGETLTLQLPNELGEWQRRASEPGFQDRIRGVGVVRDEEYVVLPAPKLFHGLVWDLKQVVNEEGALQSVAISCMADDVMISIVVYSVNKPTMTKFDVRRIGKRRWKPRS